MVIAGLNYVNISSVQSIKRSKEAGIRKATGATNKNLTFQLYIESLIAIALSYGLAILLMFLSFKVFGQIVGKAFCFVEVFSSNQLFIHLTVLLGIWLLSSVMPSLHFAFAGDLALMKKSMNFKGQWIRKGFLTFQYCISLVMIIGTVMVLKQLNFIQSKHIGFDKEGLITMEISRGPMRDNAQVITNDLVQNPNIKAVSISSSVPFDPWSLENVQISTNPSETPRDIYHFGVDKHWLETFNIDLKAGTNFSGNDVSDINHILINEKAAEAFGFSDDPIGKRFYLTGREDLTVRVIGVVADFHFQSLYDKIEPAILTSWNNPYWRIEYFTVKYHNNPLAVIEQLEDIQKEFSPERPADIGFVDQEAEKFYKADRRRGQLLLVATMVSIAISLFGLYALINFSAEIMTKQVGIRKVLGAKSGTIFKLILNDYSILLLIAFAISAPLSYWALDNWLSNFAYRIDIDLTVFVVAFVLVLTASFLTVLSRVLRLARLNPVDSLRYE